MKQSFRIVLNGLLAYGTLFFDLLLRFFLVRFALDRMGKDAYAIVVLVVSTELVMELLRVGTTAATTKYVAAGLARGDDTRNSELMSTALGYGLLTGLIGLTICMILSTVPERLANVDPSLHGELSSAFMVLGGIVLVWFALMPFSGFVSAYQRYDLVFGWVTAFRLLGALGIVICFVYWKASPSVYIGFRLGPVALVNIVYLILSHRLCPGIRIRTSSVRLWSLKALLSFSVFSFLSAMFGSAFTEGSKWIIANLLSATELTYYSIVMMLYGQTRALVLSGLRVLVPVVSRYDALEDLEAVGEVIRRGTRATGMLCWLMVVGLVPVMSPFLLLWLGPDYVWLAPHCKVVLLASLVAMPSLASSQAFMGLARVGLVAVVRAISSACGLVVLIVGMVAFDLGITAATTAVCVCSVVLGIGNHAAGVSISRQPVGGFIRDALLRPMWAGLPALLIAEVLAGRLMLESWVRVIGFAGGSVGVLVVAYALSLAKEDRKLVSEVLQRVRARRG